MEPLSLLLLFFLLGGSWSRGRRTEQAWPKPQPSFPQPVDPPAGHATGTPPAPAGKLQPFPSAGWTPYSPPPAAVVQRALALLPRLPFGEWIIEADPSNRKPDVLVLYRKEPHPKGKVGITVYKKPSAIETPPAANA